MFYKFLISVFLVVGFSLADAKSSQRSCEPVSKASAISAAQSAIKGKALSASLSRKSNPPVYRVKVLLDNGRVKTILVNACNGKVLKVG
ncbi:MAG: PepSY domain-containing protein [Gammaproteobacteria bacterium]|nr:PepSY domain-containing protein [Gammaproteobacteria bacterium]